MDFGISSIISDFILDRSSFILFKFSSKFCTTFKDYSPMNYALCISLVYYFFAFCAPPSSCRVHCFLGGWSLQNVSDLLYTRIRHIPSYEAQMLIYHFWYRGPLSSLERTLWVFGGNQDADSWTAYCIMVIGTSAGASIGWSASPSMKMKAYITRFLAIPSWNLCTDNSGCGPSWQPVSTPGGNNHYIVVVDLYHDHFCGVGETYYGDWAGRTHTNDCGHHVFEVWSQ